MTNDLRERFRNRFDARYYPPWVVVDIEAFIEAERKAVAEDWYGLVEYITTESDEEKVRYAIGKMIEEYGVGYETNSESASP